MRHHHGVAADPISQHAALCPIAAKWQLTKGQAKKEAKRLERDTHMRFSVWKCVCGSYHLGKRKQ